MSNGHCDHYSYSKEYYSLLIDFYSRSHLFTPRVGVITKIPCPYIAS